MKSLSIGDKNEEVKEAQEKLKKLGYYRGKIDSDFGPITQKAVAHFQEDYLVTGYIDGATYVTLQNEFNKLDISVPIPKNRTEVINIFGRIAYVSTANGNIRITNNWAKDNITRINLPIVGKKYVHKKLEKVFIGILDKIENTGLANEIKQFGTWAPRHILHNANKPLSLHSWGIACDINWTTNKYGTSGNMHPRIVEIFEKHGFSWGGRWRTKDPMHFEYYKR